MQRLELLVELQGKGTLGAVADSLGYTPSAISQQLHRLETEIGIPLTRKAGRNLLLTKEGEILAAAAQSAFSTLDEAVSQLPQIREQLTGTLRVGIFQTAALFLLPEIVGELTRRAPKLRLAVTEIDPDSATRQVCSGQFDLALGEEYPGYPEVRPKEVRVETVAADRMHLCIPDTYWRPGITINDVANIPLVLEPPANRAGQWGLSVCHAAGFAPEVRYSSPDLLFHAKLTQKGLAACFLPSLLLENISFSLHRGVLYPFHDRKIVLITPSHALASASVAVFSSLLKAILAKRPAAGSLR